ncbi:MAG: hypothetical protein GY697_12270 [Desulfobacterales bacterium]|nr:hypothetical protein [Desulfobacterales bacterium]
MPSVLALSAIALLQDFARRTAGGGPWPWEEFAACLESRVLGFAAGVLLSSLV